MTPPNITIFPFLQLLFKYDLVKYDMVQDEPVKDEHGFCLRVKKGRRMSRDKYHLYQMCLF